MNKKPDFFCIGMQKAGTTWLYENLKTHDSYFPCLIKEPHYYDNLYYWPKIYKQIFDLELEYAHSELAIKSDILNSVDWSLRDINKLLKAGDNVSDNFDWISSIVSLKDNILSEEWYEKVFSFCPANRITGDFTADYYLLEQQQIEIIIKENPNAKFILFIRDPVERDWSQIRMMPKYNSIEECVELLNSPPFFRRNNYEAIVENWNNLLNPSNFTIKFFDEISLNPENLLNSVASFLDISPYSNWPNARLKFFEGEKMKLPENVKEILVKRNANSIYYLSHKFVEFNYLSKKYKS
jgi:hypothetical protein